MLPLLLQMLEVVEDPVRLLTEECGPVDILI